MSHGLSLDMVNHPRLREYLIPHVQPGLPSFFAPVLCGLKFFRVLNKVRLSLI
jgi:hypothetical protein